MLFYNEFYLTHIHFRGGVLLHLMLDIWLTVNSGTSDFTLYNFMILQKCLDLAADHTYC